MCMFLPKVVAPTPKILELFPLFVLLFLSLSRATPRKRKVDPVMINYKDPIRCCIKKIFVIYPWSFAQLSENNTTMQLHAMARIRVHFAVGLCFALLCSMNKNKKENLFNAALDRFVRNENTQWRIESFLESCRVAFECGEREKEINWFFWILKDDRFRKKWR